MPSLESENLELSMTQKTLSKILENTQEGVLIIGHTRKIEYVNERICEILGHSSGELLNQSFMKFVHPDYTQLAADRFMDRLHGKNLSPIFEIRALHARNEYCDLRVTTTVLTNGENELKILVQVLDMTEERIIRDSLAEYKLKYSSLTDTMNEGLGIINDKGVLIHVNPALCKMLNYSKQEILGMTTENLMTGLTFDEVFEKIRERIIGKSSRYETTLVHRSGQLIPTLVSASPLYNDEGEYAGSLALFTDITARKLIERDYQITRNRATLYLDLLSHDIRNHLQEIQVAAELMQYNINNTDPSDLIDRILHSVSKSARIISESTTIESLAESPLKPMNLDEVLRETVMAAIILYDKIDFRMSIQVSDAIILADEYLELLISDVLSNACEHDSGTRNIVSIDFIDCEKAYELTVSSNGLELMNNITMTQVDTTQRLKGLRLQLVYHIIEKYNGILEVFEDITNKSSSRCILKLTFPKYNNQVL